MAVPESQSFHQQTRDILNSIALGGMKIDLQRGHRLTHPTFKGLPFNSTGSMNRMGFMTKAENDCPLEDKVLAGGARTQRAQEHYQKKLKGVAEWTRNQQLMKEGLPPNPPNAEEFQLPLDESLRLELENLLTSLNNLIEVGDFGTLTMREFSTLPRVLIRYLGVTTDLNDLVRLTRFIDDTIFESISNLYDPSDRSNQSADLALREKAGNVFDNIVEPVVNLIEDYMKYINDKWDGVNEKNRLTALKAAIKNNLGNQKGFIKEASEAVNQYNLQMAMQRAPARVEAPAEEIEMPAEEVEEPAAPARRPRGRPRKNPAA